MRSACLNRSAAHGVLLARLALAVLLSLGGRRALAAPVLDLRGEGVGARPTRAALEAAVRAPGDSAALSAALGKVVERLQEQGYWRARARGRWETSERLVVTVDEGARVRLASLALRVTPADDSVRVARALELGSGGWAMPGALGAAIERGVTRLVHDGYPYAELGVHECNVDSAGAHVTLAGVLGPRVTIGDVRIEGLHVTRPDVARRAMGRLVRMPFQPEAADAARERLAQLGLFRSVEYAGLESAGDWSRGTLVYKVEETKYNRFEGVIGAQGDAGVVGTANLELDNLLGTGRAAALRWDARGHGSTDLGARYTEPLVAGLPLRLEASLEQELRDTTFTRTRWGGRARWALSAADGVELGVDEERVVQPRDEVAEARLENTVFALERITLDDPVGPSRGARVKVEATQTFKRETLRPQGTRTARASAIQGESEWIRPLRPSSGLALELRAAGKFSSERVLPVFERYPLGGATSLRGFDEEAFRVDRYALSRLEWRWYVGTPRQRLYTFWDHAWGETRTRALDGRELWATLNADGLGFGLRLETAAGLAGIDYGLEPGRPPLEGKIHLRLVSSF